MKRLFEVWTSRPYAMVWPVLIAFGRSVLLSARASSANWVSPSRELFTGPASRRTDPETAPTASRTRPPGIEPPSSVHRPIPPSALAPPTPTPAPPGLGAAPRERRRGPREMQATHLPVDAERQARDAVGAVS